VVEHDGALHIDANRQRSNTGAMPKASNRLSIFRIWRSDATSRQVQSRMFGLARMAGPRMIKRGTETVHGVFTGTADTAVAEFFVLTIFCTVDITLFTWS
jgi:hypothetical protein